MRLVEHRLLRVGVRDEVGEPLAAAAGVARAVGVLFLRRGVVQDVLQHRQRLGVAQRAHLDAAAEAVAPREYPRLPEIARDCARLRETDRDRTSSSMAAVPIATPCRMCSSLTRM